MRPNELDHLVKLRFSRDRAANLRADWGMANSAAPCRITTVVHQCRTDVIELIDRTSVRMSGFRLHRDILVRDFSG